MIITSMPTFDAALIMIYTDRLGVTGFFNPDMGGYRIAYQHSVLVYVHPEAVHILFTLYRHAI